MTQLKFNAVTSLPSSPEADSFYFVLNGDYAESYLTTTGGIPKQIGNSLMVNELIEDALDNQSLNQVVIVPDIAARDALENDAETNLMVLVLDATADPTVDDGSALYAYEVGTNTWYKLAEYESMDVVLQWNDIQGRPSSSPDDIDQAVSDSHTHSDMTVLDGLGENAEGDLTYNNTVISTQWVQKEW